MEARAQRGVEITQHTGAELLLGRDAHPYRAPSLRHELLVALRHVLFALVQHGQAHDMPADFDRAHLLHFQHPPRSNPRPGTQGVEPEINDSGLLLGHGAPSSADDHGYRTSAGTACLEHNSPGWVPLALTGPGAPAFRWRRGKMPEWSVPGRTPAGPRRKDHQVASDLTRDEARERARLLDVGSYRVEVDLTGGETTFTSVTTISFRCGS